MGSKITLDRLVAACSDDSDVAGIRITTDLEPIGGKGSPVKPATYIGGKLQEDVRWRGNSPERTRAIVIDNVPSQANRLEAALNTHSEKLGIPRLDLDLSSIASLPAHLPQIISSLQWPHRNGDAYLRDACINGDNVPSTELGKRLLEATADRPQALLQWLPQGLLFGFWVSHSGKKRSQAKLARSLVSEIVGFSPAVTEDLVRTSGVKGDPLNLSGDVVVAGYDDENALKGWTVSEGAADKKLTKKLSGIGHGQVPFADDERSLAAISFDAIEQSTSISFAGLRRISLGDSDSSAVARALLVSYGLVAHTLAFGSAFSLRSGCDLRTRDSRWMWLATPDEELTPMSVKEAIAILQSAKNAASERGLLTGGGWDAEPLVLTPNVALTAAIRKSWPEFD